MTARGALKVVLEGRGPLTLRDSDYITTGGEGSIYRANATIVKIYTDAGKMVRDGMPDKVRLLADRLKHANIVAPQGVVTDERSQPVGFYMPFVDGEPLSRVFVSDFRTRTGFSDKDAVGLVAGMHDVTAAAHAAKALMVDANELNWLVQTPKNKAPVPKVIDVDSWAIGRWPATVIMPSIRDWGAKTFDEKTDWFAFGVVSFQVFTGIHPFKGKVDGYKPGELVKRMKDGISVFDPRARLPHAVRDFACIPGPLLNWYRSTFQDGERTKAPSPLDISKPAKAAQVLRAVTTATGNLLFEKLFGRPADPVTQIWPCGAARLASGEVVDLSSGMTIHRLRSPDAEVVRSGAGWLFADWIDGVPRFAYSDGPNSTPIDWTLSVKRFFRAGDRLFAVIEREVVELQLRMLGKPVVTVSRRWSILTNATRWFDGVAVQDVLGASFIFLPINGNGAVQVRVKEIDGLNVVSAKAEGRFAAFVALDRNGDYRKIELTFDRTHASYTVWAGGTDRPDLNMAILTTGVVGTIATDGELTLFVPTNGNVTKVQDRGVTTATGLSSWGDRIVYIQDGNVWRVRMKQP